MSEEGVNKNSYIKKSLVQQNNDSAANNLECKEDSFLCQQLKIEDCGKTKQSKLHNKSKKSTKENSKPITLPHSSSDGIVNLAYPGLCSALQLASEIQAISIKNNVMKSIDLSNKAEEVLKQKASKKSNVPFKKQIYKNLVDLQVNDEDIVSEKSGQSRNSNFCRSGDKVFDLASYYKPDFSAERVIKVDSKKVQPESDQYYNGMDIYNRIESLKSLT